MKEIDLHDIAPRLAKARDQHMAEIEARRRAIEARRRAWRSMGEAALEVNAAFEKMAAAQPERAKRLIESFGRAFAPRGPFRP